MDTPQSNEANYRDLLLTVKQQIHSAQARAALAVNSALIQLYWNLGKQIAENQALFEGRNSYISQLSKDLREEFPDFTGFSSRNLFYVRKFYQFYSEISVQQLVALNPSSGENPVQQPVAPDAEEATQGRESISNLVQFVPWGHHVLILNKIKVVEEALFYLKQTTEHAWTRNLLAIQIEQKLYQRQGKAITNFNTTLPKEQAQLAGQLLKDPYNFGFLTLEAQAKELDIEKQLTAHITRFLLELGKGFAFIGRQYPLQVGTKDYRLDLLFYHIRLRCFVVIDLKTGEFEPEFAGKMNFYLSVVDDQLKKSGDHPSIGIILCKSKDRLEVEYALQGMTKPIGVSEFTLTHSLPPELKASLPTIEEFENELNKDPG